MKFKGNPISALHVLSSQDGLTLFEILQAMMIFGIIVVGTFQSIELVRNTVDQGEAMSAMNHLVEQVEYATAQEDQCLLNLKGIPLLAGYEDREIVLSLFDATGVRVAKVLEKDLIVDHSIEILQVRLTPKFETAANEYVAEIEWRARNVRSDSPPEIPLPQDERPGFRMVRRIPLWLKLDATGKVLSCRGQFSEGGVKDTPQIRCNLLSDGEYYYSEKFKECRLRFVERCQSGNATNATCTGMLGAVKATKCQMLNVTDPVLLAIKRFYNDGSSKDATYPPPWNCSLPAAQPMDVVCTKASDAIEIPPGAVCQACCKVDLIVTGEAL